MSALDIFLGWISPFTDPLKDLRTHVNDLNANHANSMKQYMLALAPVAEGPSAMVGEDSTKLFADIQEFLNAERGFSGVPEALSSVGQVGTISPPPPAADTPVLEAATDAGDACVTSLEGAAEDAAAEVGGDAGLDALTGALDLASVAEGGLDIPVDAVAIILTIVDLVLKVAIIVTFLWAVYNAVQGLIQLWNQLSHPAFPALPASPVTSNAPVPVPVPTPSDLPPLTQEQQEEVDRLLKLFPDLTRSEAESFVRAGLSDSEIESLLKWLEQQRIPIPEVEQLFDDYPEYGETIRELLMAGFSPDQIRALFAAGLTDKDIENLIKYLRSTPEQSLEALLQILEDYGNKDGADIIMSLSQVLNQLMTNPNFSTDPKIVSGFQQVVTDILSNSSKTSGALFALMVMLDNLPNISMVEDVRPNGREGVDIVLKNGDVIECKNYNLLSNYYRYNWADVLSKLRAQLTYDVGAYPGTVDVCFNSLDFPQPLSADDLQLLRNDIQSIEQIAPGRIIVTFDPPVPGLP